LLLQALVLGGARLGEALLALRVGDLRDRERVVELRARDRLRPDHGDRVARDAPAGRATAALAAATGSYEDADEGERCEQSASSGHSKSAGLRRVQAARRA